MCRVKAAQVPALGVVGVALCLAVVAAPVRGATRDAQAGDADWSHADDGVVQPTAGVICEPTVVALIGDACFGLGDQVVVEVTMMNPSAPVVGGQFFMSFSSDVFDVVSIVPGDFPFTFEFPGTVIDEDLGIIDYAVGSFSGGATTDTVMARITFEVVSDFGAPFVGFREHSPPTRLSDDQGQEVPIDLVNTGQGEDVDLTNFAAFQRCFSGAGEMADGECQCLFDLEGVDGDVDELDYQLFHATLTGPSLWTCGG